MNPCSMYKCPVCHKRMQAMDVQCVGCGELVMPILGTNMEHDMDKLPADPVARNELIKGYELLYRLKKKQEGAVKQRNIKLEQALDEIMEHYKAYDAPDKDSWQGGVLYCLFKLKSHGVIRGYDPDKGRVDV